MIRRNIKIIFGILILFVFFVLFFLLRSNPSSNIVVINTSPLDGDQNVQEDKQIGIDFNKDIKENEKQKVLVRFDPGIEFDSTWLSNTYKIIPKNVLNNNQKYLVTVMYNNKIIQTFSFTTQVFNQQDIIKYGRLQSQNDRAYGQAVEKLVSQYPFYSKLPIITSNYSINYDFQLNKFQINFIDQKLTTDEQNKFIPEILDSIKKLGVSDPVQYYVNKISYWTLTGIIKWR